MTCLWLFDSGYIVHWRIFCDLKTRCTWKYCQFIFVDSQLTIITLMLLTQNWGNMCWIKSNFSFSLNIWMCKRSYFIIDSYLCWGFERLFFFRLLETSPNLSLLLYFLYSVAYWLFEFFVEMLALHFAPHVSVQ